MLQYIKKISPGTRWTYILLVSFFSLPLGGVEGVTPRKVLFAVLFFEAELLCLLWNRFSVMVVAIMLWFITFIVILLEISIQGLLLGFPNLRRKKGSKLRRRRSCWNCLYLGSLQVQKVYLLAASYIIACFVTYTIPCFVISEWFVVCAYTP